MGGCRPPSPGLTLTCGCPADTARSQYRCVSRKDHSGGLVRLTRSAPGRGLRIQPQVRQDLLDHRPLQHRCDDPQFPGAAVRAGLHVDVEDPLEQLCPFSKDSKFAFVTLQGSNKLAAIDLTAMKIAWQMPVGRTPAGVVMTPDDRHLLVGVMEDNNVVAIDWRT